MSHSMEAIESEYLSKSIEERRKAYACGNAFKKLDDIPPLLLQFKGKGINIDPNLGMRLSIWSGDITQLEIDAIANAANARLAGGGGVDGAIQRAAGPLLLKKCKLLGGCQTGSAKITIGFNLPAKYVVHCVGPVGEKPDLLASCYQTALQLCSAQNLKTIAFPCISTGVYGYPPKSAAKVATDVVLNYLKAHDEIERVIFCCFMDTDQVAYREILAQKLSFT